MREQDTWTLRDQLLEFKHEDFGLLVVSHTDGRMLRSLRHALDEHAVALLPLSQTLWNLENPNNAACVYSFVQRNGVQNVILAGHSRGVAAAKLLPERSPATTSESKRIALDPMQFLRSAQQIQTQLRQSKNHLADQIKYLSEFPAFAERLSNGTLKVDGLFYLAESSTFLLYDVVHQTFQPLSFISKEIDTLCADHWQESPPCFPDRA